MAQAILKVVVVGGGSLAALAHSVVARALAERRADALEGSLRLGGLSVAGDPDDIGLIVFYHVVTLQDRRLIARFERTRANRPPLPRRPDRFFTPMGARIL